MAIIDNFFFWHDLVQLYKRYNMATYPKNSNATNYEIIGVIDMNGTEKTAGPMAEKKGILVDNPPSRLQGLCNRARDNLQIAYRLDEKLQEVVNTAEGDQPTAVVESSDKDILGGLLGELSSISDKTNAILLIIEERIEYIKTMI